MKQKNALASEIKKMSLLLLVVSALSGCVGSGTKLVRSDVSGSWESNIVDSGIKGKPGKLVNSQAFGDGPSKYNKYAKPYINVRENPDQSVDIIYFPGLQGPAKSPIPPNQQIQVFADYPGERMEYVYRFTSDSMTGSLLFFTDFDKHAFISMMENKSYVVLRFWDRNKREWVKNGFSINGSPHVVVRRDEDVLFDLKKVKIPMY